MEFYEKFKTYSDVELLRIIENPDDYQPQAVETAKAMFSERQLSEAEIQIAKNEVETEKQQKQIDDEKVKNIGKSIFARISPIQNKKLIPENTITIISIFIGTFFFYQLYYEFSKFGALRFLFTNDYAVWHWEIIPEYLPFFLMPIVAVLFYMQKKTGWILLTILLSRSTISAIGMFVLTMVINPITPDSFFDIITPNQIPPLIYLLPFLFFLGIIWLICNEKIRNLCSISKRTMILTLAISTVVFAVAMGISLIMIFSI